MVQTEIGYHLITVTERKPGVPTEFAKIQDDVRDDYIEEMRLRLLEEERKKAKIAIHIQ